MHPGQQSAPTATFIVTSFAQPGTYRVCYLTRAAFLGHTNQGFAAASGALLTVLPAVPGFYSTLPLGQGSPGPLCGPMCVPLRGEEVGLLSFSMHFLLPFHL